MGLRVSLSSLISFSVSVGGKRGERKLSRSNQGSQETTREIHRFEFKLRLCNKEIRGIAAHSSMSCGREPV